MLRRFLRAFYMARAIAAAQNGKIDLAMARIQRAKRMNPLRFYERAFEGGTLLRQRQFEKADELLRKVMEETSAGLTDNERYVNLFCKSYLCSDETEIVRIASEANALDCDPTLRRWLPL